STSWFASHHGGVFCLVIASAIGPKRVIRAAPSPRAIRGSCLMGTSRKTWRCAKHIVRSSSEDWDALCAAIATVKGM
ncbi:MAG: hypothetical protein II592_06610, partial [Muribaculaceae bacterium]|nr:hypothetical protein [Muribaculaceae bacterium]